MGVADQPVAFQSDDLEELRVDLEIDGSVDDVDADLLHLPGPEYVVALVELRAELHQHRHGLPILLGLHECSDQGWVLSYPVQADLYALDVGVVGSIVEQAYDRRERFVGVVQYPIPLPDRSEHVHPLGELRGHVRFERLLLEPRIVEPVELPQIRQTHDVRPLDLEIAQFQIAGEEPDHVGGHGAFHYHPHGESHVPIFEGLLDGGHEVARLVYGDLNIGVPRHLEGIGAVDLQIGEQR